MTDQAQLSVGCSPKPCYRLRGALIAQLCMAAVLIGVTVLMWVSMLPPSALHFYMEASDAFLRSLVLVGLFCVLTTACLVWLG